MISLDMSLCILIRTFADVLVKFGSLAEMAAKRHAHLKNEEEKIEKLKAIYKHWHDFFGSQLSSG